MLNHCVPVIHCHMSQRLIHRKNNRAQVYLSKNQDSTACGLSVLLMVKPVITMQLFIFEERSSDLKELFSVGIICHDSVLHV